MTYLTRPVFEFPIDWTEQPSRSLSFDLREMTIGFGWPRFAPTQTHLVNGFEFTLQLQTEDEIQDALDFFEELIGPLRGFWLPSPQVIGRILDLANQDLESIELDLAHQRLNETWQLHPATHVICQAPGQTPLLGEISAVTDNLDGSERVTIDTDAPAAVDASWTIRRLHYVRLAGDAEEAQYDGENRMTARLRVIELPTEYAEAELGRRPYYLYTFTTTAGGATSTWRYTSHWEPLTVDEDIYEAKAINHGGLSRGTKGDKESCQIEAFYEPDHPLALLVPFALPGPLLVQIQQRDFGDAEDPGVIFTGEIDAVEIKGNRILARCNSLLDTLSRKLPAWQIQPRCPYQTYDARTCKLDRAEWEASATIETIDGREITVNALEADHPDDYFAFGTLETGTGPTFETRTIIADARVDADTHALTLSRELIHAEASDIAVLLPGDDHRADTCAAKFDNFANFGGHPFIPRKNLTVQAIQASPSTGGKK